MFTSSVEDEYDFIVVGSGAGGGPVAVNLAKAGYRVLVLEAGGADEPDEYKVPAFHSLSTEHSQLAWKFYVQHYANKELQCRDRRNFLDGQIVDGVPRHGIFYPRAGTLGGCTAHHAMIFVAPHDSDWDHIAKATGDESWKARSMRKYFERVERCEYLRRPWYGLNGARHGYDGWLPISIADPSLLLRDSVMLRLITAAVQTCFASRIWYSPGLWHRMVGWFDSFYDPMGLRRVGIMRRSLSWFCSLLDPNDWLRLQDRAEGPVLVPLTISKGIRVGTRELIRDTVRRMPDRLTVKLHALVTRVLLDGEKRATGVEFLDQGHLYRADPVAPREGPITAPRRTVRARYEVILAGGAFNTPQILMLSGIGPREELSRHKIETKVCLPGVGKNLHDRTEVGIVHKMKEGFAILRDAKLKADDREFADWRNGHGLYATNGVVAAIIKRSSLGQPDPDLFLFAIPGYFAGYGAEPSYAGKTMPNSPARSVLGKRLLRFFGCGETGCFACFWRCVHEFALFLWVARAPFGVVAVGYLLLGAAPQAQDLLIPLVDSSPPYVLLFFVLHFLFWAMPVHYSARILLSDDKRLYEYGLNNPSPYFDWLERWIPRLLGAVTFLALIMSAYRANSNLPNIKDHGVITTLSKNLYYFMGWSGVGFVVFLNYTAYRTKMAEWVPSSLLDKLTSLTRPLLNPLDIGGHRSARPFKPDEMNPNDTGLLLLIIVFVIFVIVLLAAPNQVAERLPLAFSVSLMLGGWVPILTYLSAIGRRLQAPLIIGAFGAVAILTSIFGDNHDVRLIEGSTAQGPMSLNQALSVWMDSNNCTPEKAENCPRPIIVAASGGASRAGFFTVSVLGELLDKASKHGLNATELRKRLFAISSVSGSSVGAVMTVAALAAGGRDTKFPCRPDRFSYWYGDRIENWRGCLENLMTGDFITPTFIGLAFHDMIPFGPWHDRATIIEQSWERRFANAMLGGERPCPADLKCPFYSLRPTMDLWLPMLVLNGVSVTTGQRIITTLLDRKYAAPSCPSGDSATACPLFAETWPFHDFLHDETPSSDWRAWLQRVITGPYLAGRKNNDIQLSTAAHNSARFPIVSPPGNIRNQAHYIVDRIVDGGYMENFGVLAAFELAQAVHAVIPELKPFVLVISNDPNEPVAMVESPDKAGATGFLTDLTSLVAAIGNTRDARGSLAVKQLRNLSLSLTLPKCNVSFAHIRVWPERVDPNNNNCTTENFSKTPRAVSLSWWLSTPIQFRLFEEIEGPETCNKSALKDVWKAIPMKSDCLE